MTDDDPAALVTLASSGDFLVHTAVTDRGLSHLSRVTTAENPRARLVLPGAPTMACFRGRDCSLEDVSLLDTPVTFPPLVALSGRHTTLPINSSTVSWETEVWGVWHRDLRRRLLDCTMPWNSKD
ncbi:MAG: hypothetical protein CM1200mP2_46490 [Planctomycetaceae bacterium]|nr:MAG: hypothetical protein CM1200mP2_46490 [Planctomycetaceae bacterium]